MSRDEVRRDRLSQFVDLARIYRRWTKIQTAQALGREPSKVVPESGNPKLDLVVGLAEALDWDVGDVAEGEANGAGYCLPCPLRFLTT